MTLFFGCNLFEGHYSTDGSRWIWNKNPNGSYNSDNPLKLDQSTKWVNRIIGLKKLRKLKIEVFSHKFDDYEVNDTGVFLKNGKLNNGNELLKYKSATSMAKQLGISDTSLIKLVNEFDKLKLNRFYREDEYFAFVTNEHWEGSRGYVYFIDSTITRSLPDSFDLQNFGECKNWNHSKFARFKLLNKFDSHWIKWRTGY